MRKERAPKRSGIFFQCHWRKTAMHEHCDQTDRGGGGFRGRGE